MPFIHLDGLKHAHHSSFSGDPRKQQDIMNLLGVLCYSLPLVFVCGVDAGEKKLQIGIKKRVDPAQCTTKSRKGDVLHMHYTV